MLTSTWTNLKPDLQPHVTLDSTRSSTCLDFSSTRTSLSRSAGLAFGALPHPAVYPPLHLSAAPNLPPTRDSLSRFTYPHLPFARASFIYLTTDDDDDDDLLVNLNCHPLVDNPALRGISVSYHNRYRGRRYNTGNSRPLFAPSPITWLAQRRRCTTMCTPRRCAAPAWATLAPSRQWGQPPERGIPPG